MEDSTNKAAEDTIGTEIQAGGITANAQTTGFVDENTYGIGAHKVNAPIREEGVSDTRDEYSDETLFKLFGKEATTVLGIEEKEKIDESIDQNIKSNVLDLPGNETKSEEPPAEKVEVKDTASATSVMTSADGTVTPVKTYTEEELNDILNSKLTEEVQKFQHINTFFEEYQKDPYNYMAKHSPHLFEKFDEIQYVKDKLAEEFGEFTPDPQRVYQIGTTDYTFRVRQDQLLFEAQSLKSQAQSNLESRQAAVIQDEQNYKAAKAKALGLDLSTFESKVWNLLKGMDNQKVLDTLVDAVIYRQKLEEKDANIKQQIDLTKAAPSPVNLAGTGRPQERDKDMDLLIKMFGPK